MSNPKFTIITTAECDHGYLDQALMHIAGFVGELFEKAGTVGARYGVLTTGHQTGNLVLLQSYNSLADVEKVFDVYAASDDYQAVINSGKLRVALRNILKLEDINVSIPSTEMPKFGIVSRFSGGLHMDLATEMLPVWEAGGAMLLRYGTLITGSDAGKRGLIAGFPSMDAIEKTYDALNGNAAYQKVLSSVDMDFRNIIRVLG